MEKINQLLDDCHGDIDPVEIGEMVKKLNLPPHDVLAIAAGVFEHQRRRESVNLGDKDDDDDDDDDYEAAMLKHERRLEKKRLSVFDSSCSPNKNLKTHSEERECMSMSEKDVSRPIASFATPLPLMKQGGSSVSNHLYGSPKKSSASSAGTGTSCIDERRMKEEKKFWEEIKAMHVDEEEIDKILKKLNLPKDERSSRIAKYSEKKMEKKLEKSSVSCFSHSSEKHSSHGGYNNNGTSSGKEGLRSETFVRKQPMCAPAMVNLSADFCFSSPKKMKRSDRRSRIEKGLKKDLILDCESSSSLPIQANKAAKDWKNTSEEPEMPTEQPIETRKKITDLKLILQKPMHKSDLLKGEERLSIPIDQIKTTDFLADEEKRRLGTKQDNMHESEIKVKLFDLNKKVADGKLEDFGNEGEGLREEQSNVCTELKLGPSC